MVRAIALEEIHSSAGSAAKPLRIYMLGRFEVEQGERRIEHEQWRSGKARSLFKIMLSRRGFAISRQEAAELLWPELDTERAANNLNQALYSLRRMLEPGLKQAGDSAYLKADGSKLHLNCDLIEWIDLDEFKQLYQQAHLIADMRLYEQATEIYRGDYLPEDLYEDWSVYRREALRQDWLELLQEMAALYQAQGQTERYRQCLHRILETDFSHEEAVQKLMLALAEAGRRDEALSLYRNFANKMQTRLSLEPLDGTRQLFENISTGKIGARGQGSGTRGRGPGVGDQESEFGNQEPTIETLRTQIPDFRAFSPKPKIQNNQTSLLQFPVAPVVGRKAEQQSWQRYLSEALEGRGSLTLLAGEAGVGKTHLAQTLARQAVEAGFEVVYVTCYAGQADLPFVPLCDLLEQAFSKLETHELEECLQLCPPELYQLLPGLAGKVQGSRFKIQSSELAVQNPEPLNVSQPASTLSSQALFIAVVQVLAWLRNKGPVVVLLDDLHYLPEPSLRLLRCLLTHPNLRNLPILGTVRVGTGSAAQPELQRLLQGAGGTIHKVQRLKRLEREELRELVTTQLGQPPAGNLLQILVRASRSNPRLVVGLLSSWREAGRLRLVAGQWDLDGDWDNQLPLPITGYIRQLVASLSREAQVLLALAALIAAQPDLQFTIEDTPAPEHLFSFEALRQIVLHRQDGAGWWIELDKTRLGQALTEITGCGLVEEREMEFRFSYPLLVEALVDSLPHSQRQCWKEVINWVQRRISAGLTSAEEFARD